MAFFLSLFQGINIKRIQCGLQLCTVMQLYYSNVYRK